MYPFIVVRDRAVEEGRLNPERFHASDTRIQTFAGRGFHRVLDGAADHADSTEFQTEADHADSTEFSTGRGSRGFHTLDGTRITRGWDGFPSIWETGAADVDVSTADTSGEIGIQVDRRCEAS
jgi:hypothetical protein